MRCVVCVREAIRSLNLELSAQYTGYTRFNGTALNYDGTGRDAKSNNTVYLVAR